jgi:hypothetical protein
MTDALYAVMSSDREVYAREVVDRLEYQERLIKATQHFKDEKTLPLPAQMFRMGSELAHKKNPSFSYSLLSMWPINKQNGPTTEVETMGLRAVAETGQNYYTEEMLGGQKYFSAFYPDKGVVEACVQCHNSHEDSPRRDFRVGDVLGGRRDPRAARRVTRTASLYIYSFTIFRSCAAAKRVVWACV